MNMIAKARNFILAEDGAATVDWVVITSALVGLGIFIVSSVGGATNVVGGKISTSLVEVTITLQ